MSAPDHKRRSFVYRRLIAERMSFAARGDGGLGRRPEPPGSAAGLRLVDLSVVPRWGLKGRDALPWLGRHDAATPSANNLATRQQDGTLIARLSPAEALILASPVHGGSLLAPAIDAMAAAGEGACYPVPRRDSHCWFLLMGDEAPNLLARLCAVDLSAGVFADFGVAQTSLAGLSTIIIRNDLAGLAFFLLADSASAEYLWDCLLDAMTEFAGVVCGAEVFSITSPGGPGPAPGS